MGKAMPITSILSKKELTMSSSLFTKSATILKYVKNEGYQGGIFPNPDDNLNNDVMDTAQFSIKNWLGYQPTPLVSLNEVARACNVKAVYYKDESHRFGLKSFKALGGAYAIARLVEKEKKAGRDPKKLTVTTATDGNHGRSLAWGAQKAGCNAKIYIHRHVSKEREMVMASYGATVTRVDGNYEDSLAACKTDAELNGWQIVSDTSWEGYRDVPLLIMAGYTLIGQEVVEQLGDEEMSHCFLPIGVGGLAGGVVAPIWRHMNCKLPKMISVESHMSACFLESIAAQTPTLVNITEETLMAGLSCGEVSTLAWELLRSSLSHCLAIDDNAIAYLMAKFADGTISGSPIEAGECSTSGLAALLAAKQDQMRWKELELDKDSTILLLGTEGATDVKLYTSLISEGRA